MPDPIIRVLPDSKAVADEAARHIVHAARKHINHKGSFTIALAGGSTPELLYKTLAAEPHRSQIPWSKVQLYFGDERCVPPGHQDSNYAMAERTLLNEVEIPDQNVQRLRGEIDPEQAAIEYGRMLQERFGDDGGLDLVLLGMGDDGHTLTLFPHTAAIKETIHRCVANHVDKLNAWRLTLTATFVNRADEVLVLVTGATKAKALREVLEGERDPQRLPIQLIDPRGQMTWLVDVAAAGM